MSNTQVGNVYQQIIADVIESSRVDFEEGGVDEHVLEELRQGWQQKLSQLQIATFPWDPKPEPIVAPPPQNMPNYQPMNTPPIAQTQSGMTLPALGQSSNGPRIKAEPGLETKPVALASQPFPNPVLNMPNATTAQQRAAAHLANNYGPRAAASISAIQGSIPLQQGQQSIANQNANVMANIKQQQQQHAHQLGLQNVNQVAHGNMTAGMRQPQYPQQQAQQYQQQQRQGQAQAQNHGRPNQGPGQAQGMQGGPRSSITSADEYRLEMARKTAAQAQAHAAQAAQNGVKSAQMDGAGDDFEDAIGVVKGVDARGNEVTMGRIEIDGLIRSRIEAMGQSMEGGGLMVPLKQVPKSTKRARKAAGTAQTDGPGSDGSDDKEPVKDEELDEDAINSDLDDPDDGLNEDDDDEETLGHIMLCVYDKVQRVKNKWKCVLKDGVLTVNGREYVFHKATGEYEW